MTFALNRSGVVASSHASRSVSDGVPPAKVPSFFQPYIDDYHEYGPDLDAHARKLYMHLRNTGHDRMANLFMSSYEGLETGFFTAIQIGPALVKGIVGMSKPVESSDGLAQRMIGGALETARQAPGAILGAYHAVTHAADLKPKEFAEQFSPIVIGSVSALGVAHMWKTGRGFLSAHARDFLPLLTKGVA